MGKLAKLGLLVVLGLLAACSGTVWGPPELQGPAAVVRDGGDARLWLLTKQEEIREVRVGTGGRRSSANTRRDTFYHFELRALDPETARPQWTRRLLSYGDPDARGPRPSRVVGSSVDGRLLGQEAGFVWLLIDGKPWVVRASDGTPVAHVDQIEAANPALQGLLPNESKFYGFDDGLVFLSADARPFRIRGADLVAQPYTAPPPPPPPEAPRYANGRERVVPLRMQIGEEHVRHAVFEGRWIGLYSDKEAADAVDDGFGDHLMFPYSILNEPPPVRRKFWVARIEATQRFDDRYDRLVELVPVPDAPEFLRGRFLKDYATGEARVLADPAGLAVWHATRIDTDGRLALTRLDAALKPVWRAELPLSDSSTGNPVSVWPLPEHLLMVGQESTVRDGYAQRELQVVSVRLADGAVNAWNLTQDGK